MSSQHKLYNYEVSPPAEVWKHISQELEDVNGFRNVSKKLQALQVAPPPIAWDHIAGELDEEQSFTILAKKLSAVSVHPPAEMWHRINGELDLHLPVIKKEAPVIPLRKRVIRYAVAAATLGVLILTANLMVQRSDKDVDVITQTFADNIPPAANQAAVTQPDAMQLAQQPAKNQDSNVQAPNSTAAATSADGYVTTSNGNMYTTSVERNREMDGRYIVLMTEDGNVVRMNKKVSNMADCIAGEVETQECTNQIAEWQKELANMPVLASPDNILGLLELASKEPATAGL